MKDNREDDIVKPSDTMVLWAFRYCLGRRSYAVNDCVVYLMAHWKEIDKETKKIIHRDIREAFEEENYGMEMDKRSWEHILELEIEED